MLKKKKSNRNRKEDKIIQLKIKSFKSRKLSSKLKAVNKIQQVNEEIHINNGIKYYIYI